MKFNYKRVDTPSSIFVLLVPSLIVILERGRSVEGVRSVERRRSVEGASKERRRSVDLSITSLIRYIY